MELLRVRLRGCCGEDSEAVAGEVTEPLRREAGDREDISDSWCILIWQKFFAGIIFQWRNHPWTEEILCRDAFSVEESSLGGRNSLQGLFSNGEIIPERKECFAGIIFQWRNHPWAEEILCRDYFPAEKSSLDGRNSLQGLFSNGEIISERKKFFAGIIFQWRNHP